MLHVYSPLFPAFCYRLPAPSSWPRRMRVRSCFNVCQSLGICLPFVYLSPFYLSPPVPASLHLLPQPLSLLSGFATEPAAATSEKVCQKFPEVEKVESDSEFRHQSCNINVWRKARMLSCDLSINHKQKYFRGCQGVKKRCWSDTERGRQQVNKS